MGEEKGKRAVGVAFIIPHLRILVELGLGLSKNCLC